MQTGAKTKLNTTMRLGGQLKKITVYSPYKAEAKGRPTFVLVPFIESKNHRTTANIRQPVRLCFILIR